jgi:hypothetical protein
MNGVAQAGDIGCYDGPATCLGFERDKSEGLGVGWYSDDVGDAVPTEQLGAIRVWPEIHEVFNTQ